MTDQIQLLRAALERLLSTGGGIADADDADLQAAIDDPQADEIVKLQAAAVLNAREALTRSAQGSQSTAWPKARDVGRFGDMSPADHIRVGLDSDNDVYVSVWGEDGGASVEFVNPGGGGGGSSRRTREALIALMVAMEADNADRPDKDWWARRGGNAAQAQEGSAA